jgi:rhomboid protease GluP
VAFRDESPPPAPPAPPPAPRPWVILALIAINLVVFAIELARGADPMSPSTDALLPLGANYAPRTLGGEPWRLVTAMFLHFGALHVGMNMLCLWQGRIVEQLFGRVRFAAIYLTSGLVGGVATLLRDVPVVSVGASGAVFGVYGAFAAFLWLRRARIPVDVWQRTARSMATFLGLNLFIGLSVPGIDMRAHVGGLAAGFVCGAVLLAGARAAEQGTRRAIALLVAGVVVAAAAVVILPRPQDIQGVLEELDRLEHASATEGKRLGTAVDAKQTTGAQAADELEREVIAPWRELAAELDALHPPKRLEPLVVAMRRLATARVQAWELFDRWLRAAPADRPAIDAQIKQLRPTVEQDVRDVDAELAGLR